MVDDWSIENVIEANIDDLDEAARILVRMANDRGGKDNITAVLVRVDDEPEPEYAPEYAEEDYVEDEEHDDAYTRRDRPTAPSLQAYDESEYVDDTGEGEAHAAHHFKDITDEDIDEERTAPHSPVFAWDDEEEDEPEPPPQVTTRPAPRPQPVPRQAPPAPAEMRRRMQNTEELPSIIVDEEDDSVVVDDSLYKR